MAVVDRKIEKFEKPVSYYINVIAGLVGLVFIWRGVWGLLDLFLLPSHPVKSRIVSIIIGFLIVLLLADLSAVACPDI